MRSTRSKLRENLLKENMTKFLPVLMEDEALSEMGWPNISIEEIVVKVLIWCEMQPSKSADVKKAFEGNVETLLNLVLAEKFTETAKMGNKSPNEILLSLLELDK